MFGGGLIYQAIGQAIVSDLAKSAAQFSSALGIRSALSGAGFLFGALGAGHLGLKTSYAIAALLGTVNCFLVALALPETMLSKPTSVSTPASSKISKTNIFSSLSAFTRIFTRHQSPIGILSFLLVLQSFPNFMGDVFQIYCKAEWGLEKKAFSHIFALFGILGIVANSTGSILVRQLELRWYTALTAFSSIFPCVGAILFGKKGYLAGQMIGVLGLAQNLGVLGALVSEGQKQGIPSGELAGERSSLTAMVKVIGPLWYYMLYVTGKRLWDFPNLPFLFNASLGLIVFGINFFNLVPIGSSSTS